MLTFEVRGGHVDLYGNGVLHREVGWFSGNLVSITRPSRHYCPSCSHTKTYVQFQQRGLRSEAGEGGHSVLVPNSESHWRHGVSVFVWWSRVGNVEWDGEEWDVGETKGRKGECTQ